MMGNNPMQMFQQFMEFQKQFKGDPKEVVQNLIASGKINQEQLNQLQTMAQQFQAMFQTSSK